MSISHKYYRTLPRWGTRLSRQFISAFGRPASLWMPSDVTNKAYDFSSNRNIGSVNTGVITTTNNIGIFRQNWKFDGTTGNIPILSIPTTTYPFTIASIFSMSSLVTNGDDNALFSFGTSTSLGNVFQIGVHSTNQFSLNARDNGGTTETITTKTLAVGEIHVGVGVFASSTSRTAYIDGGNSVSSSTLRTPSGINSAVIGRNPISWTSFKDFWAGWIGCIIVWNSVLTDTQISSLYSSLLYGSPYTLLNPRINRQSFFKTTPLSSSFRFRRTLSSLGTRTGTRQSMA